MILVSVNRIRACKKLVLYFRFLETAARQISECRGQFEILPESSQTSSMNLVFASDYLDVKEIRDFGLRIKDYFKLSPAFVHMSANLALVDPDLKRHCEAVKYQKGSMKELAEYYVSYMDRMGKEADPRVKTKLAAKEYSDSIQTMNAGFGAPGAFPPGNFPGHPGPGFGGMPGFPQPPGGPAMGRAGHFNMGGNFPGAPQGGNPFGGAPPGGHSFGGAGGFSAGGGFGAPGPQGHNFGGQQQFGGAQGYNPFAAGPPHHPQAQTGGGFQMSGQAGGPSQPFGGSQNPFAQTAQPEYAKPPITSMSLQPSPYNVPQVVQGQDPAKQYDDIFGDPKVPTQNATFGGDKKPGNASDGTDDFLKQLEDLKKL